MSKRRASGRRPAPEIRIVCPYTRLHPATEAVLRPLGAEFYDVSADDGSYWDALKGIWPQGGRILLVEHDIEPTLEQIAEVAGCPEPVCAIAYPYPGVPRLVDAGFLKVDIDRCPVGWNEPWSVLPEGARWHWRDVSCYLRGRLPPIHVHEGLVRHHRG